MNAGVNVEGSCFRLARSRNHVAIEIADKEPGGGYLRECVAVRVDQKKVIVARHHQRKMVADAFLHPKARGKAEASR